MFSKEFVQAVNHTWQAIGSDILQCAEECSDEVDNESAVESCIDADHIVTYGGVHGQAAQDEFRVRVRETSYANALSEAVKSLPYPLV